MPAVTSAEILIQRPGLPSSVVRIYEALGPQRLEGAEKVTRAAPPVKVPLGSDGYPVSNNPVEIRETRIPEPYQIGDEK